MMVHVAVDHRRRRIADQSTSEETTMESNRFDLIARQVSTTGTRRRAIMTLAAGGLGIGLAKLGLADSEAKNKKKKKKGNGATCKKSDQCKGSLVCQVALATDDCYPTAEKRCCVKEGGFCNDGCECCGVGAICNGHVCQSTN
jgi:hypothetical protein